MMTWKDRRRPHLVPESGALACPAPESRDPGGDRLAGEVADGEERDGDDIGHVEDGSCNAADLAVGTGVT
jgi:hypothetical protein